MPMTVADWKKWSVEKRGFYAKLLACYSYSSSGSLQIDSQKRLELIREQLQKQAMKGEECILPYFNSASYLLIKAVDPDGNYIKSELIDNAQVLCLKSTELAANGVLDEPDEPHVSITKQLPRYLFPGGIMSKEIEAQVHFVSVVADKMLKGNRNKNSTLKEIKLVPISNVDDLDLLAEFTLDPLEMDFILADPIVKDALEVEAKRLLETQKKEKIEQADLFQQIINHIKLASKKQQTTKSLATLGVTRIRMFMAMCTHGQFNHIAKFAAANLSVVSTDTGRLGFISRVKPIRKLIGDGLLECTTAGEFIGLISAYIWLKKQTLQKQEQLQAKLATLFQEISREQIDLIMQGELPTPPVVMGDQWDYQLDSHEILRTLRQLHCLDLFNIASKGNCLREDAHSVFGLDSVAAIEALNEVIYRLWDAEHKQLVAAIGGTVKRMKQEALALPGRNGFFDQTASAYTLDKNAVEDSSYSLG